MGIAGNIILKGVGGFYSVLTPSGIVSAKPRGIFRETGEKPLPGDNVQITEEPNGEEFTHIITEILPRKNVFVRPPVANADNFFIVASIIEPKSTPLLIDTLAVAAEYKGADVYIIITKGDLSPTTKLLEIYAKTPIKTILSDGENSSIKKLCTDKLSIFCGNSGVGKSTLLNNIFKTKQKTAPISRKLGRGVHTTRTGELFLLPGGGFVADTAGFSSFSLPLLCDIDKTELKDYFGEFCGISPCRFSDCSHNGETGCAVFAAVQSGQISKERYESYSKLYRDLDVRC